MKGSSLQFIFSKLKHFYILLPCGVFHCINEIDETFFVLTVFLALSSVR